MAKRTPKQPVDYAGWMPQQLQDEKTRLLVELENAAGPGARMSRSEAAACRREITAIEAALGAFDESVTPAEAGGWQP